MCIIWEYNFWCENSEARSVQVRWKLWPFGTASKTDSASASTRDLPNGSKKNVSMLLQESLLKFVLEVKSTKNIAFYGFTHCF
jgi:hypothetical protein